MLLDWDKTIVNTFLVKFKLLHNQHRLLKHLVRHRLNFGSWFGFFEYFGVVITFFLFLFLWFFNFYFDLFFKRFSHCKCKINLWFFSKLRRYNFLFVNSDWWWNKLKQIYILASFEVRHSCRLEFKLYWVWIENIYFGLRITFQIKKAKFNWWGFHSLFFFQFSQSLWGAKWISINICSVRFNNKLMIVTSFCKKIQADWFVSFGLQQIWACIFQVCYLIPRIEIKLKFVHNSRIFLFCFFLVKAWLLYLNFR